MTRYVAGMPLARVSVYGIAKATPCTVTTNVWVLLPLALVAVRVAVYVPAVA